MDCSSLEHGVVGCCIFLSGGAIADHDMVPSDEERIHEIRQARANGQRKQAETDEERGQHAKGASVFKERGGFRVLYGVVIDVRQQQHLHGANGDVDDVRRVFRRTKFDQPAHCRQGQGCDAGEDRECPPHGEEGPATAADGTRTHLGMGDDHERYPLASRGRVYGR